IEQDRRVALQAQLSAFGPPPYIGVTWRAGAMIDEVWRGQGKPTLAKLIPVRLIGEMLRGFHGTVVILQRRPATEELAEFRAALGRDAMDLSAVNDDLRDALALLSLLDEHIGVSNTNMHLAAGIGRTARVLVNHPAEWRWWNDVAASRWFPGFSVYRQTVDFSSDAALQRLAQDLR